MNIIEQKIIKNKEKYYSYPIKVANDIDSTFLEQSKTTGLIFFGKKEITYPKFWRNEKFKLPFNEFSIKEYEDINFELLCDNMEYYHLIFCQKGIKFIEYTFIDCMYTLYNIASSLELDYYIIPNHGTNETHSIEVDIHKLNGLMNL